MRTVRMDAYLQEELYDIVTYNIQNPNAADFESIVEHPKAIKHMSGSYTY
jgi:hypothetical protein